MTGRKKIKPEFIQVYRKYGNLDKLVKYAEKLGFEPTFAAETSGGFLLANFICIKDNSKK
jgi:hypothetical protein